MATHVPAWRRLGLKLKNEHGKPTPKQNSAKEEKQLSEAVEPDTSVPERPAKRRRFAHKQETGVKRSDSSDQAESNDNGTQQSTQISEAATLPIAAAVSSTKRVKRKKSVTFTTDTKSEDGDSRITIDFPEGSPFPRVKADQLSNIEAPQIKQADVLDRKANKDSRDVTTQVKKRKEPRDGKKPRHDTPAGKEKGALALEYLSQHQSDRESWKFNKNRDIWILSKALDVQSIPITYCLALANYVAGLPAKAGARSRLVKECNDVFDQNRTEKDYQQGERDNFLELLTKPSSVSNSDVSEFLKNHSRPAILLWALGHEVPSSSQRLGPEKHMQQPSTIGSGKRVKKKKARVLRDIEFSSSESESEVEGEDIADKPGVANGRNSDTSSSDSETSSSSPTSSDESSSASDSSE